MKKQFVEPEMKRFELDLSENIAASLIEYVISTFTTVGTCVIVNTGIPVGTEVSKDDIASCIAYVQTRMAGTVAVPLEEMRQFIRY